MGDIEMEKQSVVVCEKNSMVDGPSGGHAMPQHV